jgi:hypothetical protein
LFRFWNCLWTMHTIDKKVVSSVFVRFRAPLHSLFKTSQLIKHFIKTGNILTNVTITKEIL